jgi:hypothetical protein
MVSRRGAEAQGGVRSPFGESMPGWSQLSRVASGMALSLVGEVAEGPFAGGIGVPTRN